MIQQYPFLGIYRREMKSRSLRAICTPLFTEALVTSAKRWKQLLVNRWMDKENMAYTVKYYSAIKRRISFCMLQNGWNGRALYKVKKPARTDTAFYTYMSYLNLTKQMEYGGSQSLKEKRKWGVVIQWVYVSSRARWKSSRDLLHNIVLVVNTVH